MLTALPNRCILCTDIKSPYRISKVQDFVPHIISFSKDFSMQMFVIKLSLLLILILSEVKKKVAITFWSLFRIGEQKYLSRLAWGMCSFISVFCEQRQ